MKIGDVKVGAILALDCSQRYSRYDPRAVEVVEITTVEERYWDKFHQQQTRNVRRVKVKMVDPPATDYAHAGLAGLAKGHVTVVEARHLITEWSKLAPGILKKIEEAAAKEALEKATEARIKALGFRPNVFAGVSVKTWGARLEVEFEGKALDRILELAEAGLAAQS